VLKLKKVFEDSPIGLNGYAKLLGVSGKTLYNKLTGATDFSYPEYQKLKSLLPKYNVDYLLTEDFNADVSVPSASATRDSA